ncbi:hypothetical protein Acr_27g0010310 [Actinidia rufa]|uniref:Uncharacterized protein n=1 Tax=Actinidia rufa TaxID=165716 RepID=A0A7J0H866_9ERIC|nr:hypothetical protein Acr_27g0010310 [Actinidia rufa]
MKRWRASMPIDSESVTAAEAVGRVLSGRRKGGLALGKIGEREGVFEWSGGGGGGLGMGGATETEQKAAIDESENEEMGTKPMVLSQTATNCTKCLIQRCGHGDGQSRVQTIGTFRQEITLVSLKRWRGYIYFDMDSQFHALKAVASAAEEVIRPRLREIKHVPPSPGNVGDEVLVIAVVVVCLVHLQDIVGVLVKHKH